MNDIPISKAKELANQFRALGVVIFALDGERFQLTSFGQTRALCDGMKGIAEAFAEMIEGAASKVLNDGTK